MQLPARRGKPEGDMQVYQIACQSLKVSPFCNFQIFEEPADQWLYIGKGPCPRAFDACGGKRSDRAALDHIRTLNRLFQTLRIEANFLAHRRRLKRSYRVRMAPYGKSEETQITAK
jgi:hypothetical protein